MSGFECSNWPDRVFIAVKSWFSSGLDALGQENPDLIRSVSALAGGIGFSGEVSGALTGGACLVSLCAGRGRSDEDENPEMRIMIRRVGRLVLAKVWRSARRNTAP